ncbi:MAG: S8 family serine peptidase [Thermoguttaceae bacterium]
MGKRHLSLEVLEKREVLSVVGPFDAGPDGADWQSVIVSLKDDVADVGAAASGLMRSFGGQLGHVYQDALKGFSACLPAAAAGGLAHHPLVKTIEPNQTVQAFGWPSGTPYVVPTGVDRIDADLPGKQTDWGNVDVAIVDTGIDPNHPDLNVSSEGVRYNTRMTGPLSKRSISDGNFADDNGHGSHVAGIVGAKNNPYGVVGVAPGARLWGVKVLDSSGYGTVADIAAGVNWVVAHNAQGDADIEVINMSLGLQGTSSALHEAIQGAVGAGIVVVVAAGNSAMDVLGPDGQADTNDDFIPAAYSEVITVSAMVDTDGIPGGLGAATSSGRDDSFASFSNYSNTSGAIDLLLPGVNIWSTWYDGSYVEMSGTSMAAPHAAGLAARYIAEKYLSSILRTAPTSKDDVAAIRLALVGQAIGQDTVLGLTNHGDPDAYHEPIGWAGPVGLTDYPPAVKVTAPEAGATVSGSVTLQAVVFNDDGPVNQVEFFVNDDLAPIGSDSIADGGWSFAWDTTDLSNGLYKLTAKATETEGAQSGISVPIFVTVQNASASGAVHVGAMVGTVIPGRRGKWQAQVAVTVVDASGSVVPGATVTGTWSGATVGIASGITGAGGVATLTSRSISTAGSVTLTVTDIVLEGYAYNTSADVDSDSSVPGTNITITGPTTASTHAAGVEAVRLAALYEYLAEDERVEGRDKKEADTQADWVDMLIAYGM